MPPEPEQPLYPWNVSNSDDGHSNYCIMAQMAIQVDVSYNNRLGQTVTTGFDVPKSAQVNQNMSGCWNDSQTLVLNFVVVNAPVLTLLHFTRNQSDFLVDQVLIQILITKELFPGLKQQIYGKPS